MSDSKTIHQRDDTKPERGTHEYGDVEFADPTNHKYPIDTPEHIRAAHSYIHHKDNAAKYSASEVRTIKERIDKAATAQGIELTTD